MKHSVFLKFSVVGLTLGGNFLTLCYQLSKTIGLFNVSWCVKKLPSYHSPALNDPYKKNPPKIPQLFPMLKKLWVELLRGEARVETREGVEALYSLNFRGRSCTLDAIFQVWPLVWEILRIMTLPEKTSRAFLIGNINLSSWHLYQLPRVLNCEINFDHCFWKKKNCEFIHRFTKTKLWIQSAFRVKFTQFTQSC